MDHLNEQIATPFLTPAQAPRAVPKRYNLRGWVSNNPAGPAPRQVSAKTRMDEPACEASGAPLVIQRLETGHAVTLSDRKLSVLRIAHGRVWVTVTEAGPCSRVMAGDHFLGRGDSLTLLPGQELVMEPFGRGEMTSAQFSWGTPGAAATVTPLAASPNWRGGVLQPLMDLRHASGLAARAMGRLALGLGHAAVAEVERVGTYVAMTFVADYAGKKRAGSTFDAVSKDTVSLSRLY